MTVRHLLDQRDITRRDDASLSMAFSVGQIEIFVFRINGISERGFQLFLADYDVEHSIPGFYFFFI